MASKIGAPSAAPGVRRVGSLRPDASGHDTRGDLLAKLNARDRVHLVILAYQAGLGPVG